MRVINASYNILNNENVNPARYLESIGRICYKSEDKIVSDSAGKFFSMILKNGHTAMLEHYRFVFEVANSRITRCIAKLASGGCDGNNGRGDMLRREAGYIHICSDENAEWKNEYIAVTIRTLLNLIDMLDSESVAWMRNIFCGLVELIARNNTMLDFSPVSYDRNAALCAVNNCRLVNIYASEVKAAIVDNYGVDGYKSLVWKTVVFTCDRGVSHELVRHRAGSFAQESTRYVNYSKEKFGNQITFIRPLWIRENNLGEYSINEHGAIERNGTAVSISFEPYIWIKSCLDCEANYMKLLSYGWKPEQARSVLNNSTKTEIALTMSYKEWEAFFKLRDDVHAHPQMVELANPLHTEMQERFDIV